MRNRNARKSGTSLECRIIDVFHIIRELDARQPRTTKERRLPNARTIGNYDGL